MIDMNMVPDNMGDFAQKALSFSQKAQSNGVSNIAIKNTIDMMHGLTKGKIEQRQREQEMRLKREQFEYGKSQDSIANQLAREKFDWQKQMSDRESGTVSTGILSKQAASGKSFLEDVTDGQGNFIDVIRQNPNLSQEDILALAQANVNKYGQFRETPEELRALGLPVEYMGEMGLISGVDPSSTGSSYAKGYADQVASGAIKLSEVPADVRSEVVAYMNENNISANSKEEEMGEDAKMAVSLIDDILGRGLSPVTGMMSVRAGIHGTQASYTAGKIKQLESLLQLAQAGKLKGQGSMSDAERKILADAASSLRIGERGASSLGKRDFKTELNKIRAVLMGEQADITQSGNYTIERVE